MPAARRAIPIQPLPASAEWHIAGIVVHALPASLAHVRAAIEAIAGAEIHAVSDSGKLVVTLEAPSSRAIAAHLTFLHQLDGVLSAALVYQHNEDAEAMHEAVNPALNEEAGS
ncbi:Periplasmic nitrate reductase accessory protein [Cupriavidus taiwanensis]|uniref:Chaperone NapD n=1 Tax=Cupriavidus taiwanensis TaxID=164546 RepID=A0A375C4U6_9BURK|nr:chaperone NapD [Cupriavidus taiwanensis]SOY62691.1 Periplasmic nitrate reductase accessory protein [Cupriavidus taiwanensis]